MSQPLSTNANEPVITPEEEARESIEQDIRNKIIFLLEVFPYLARSMIQVGLSPALPPKLWDPILGSMVDEGAVCKVDVVTTNPGNRTLTKTIYHLPQFPYPPVANPVA